MIAGINFIVMLVSALLFSYFYVKSVGPAALEKKRLAKSLTLSARDIG
jgi:hypothetical protein